MMITEPLDSLRSTGWRAVGEHLFVILHELFPATFDVDEGDDLLDVVPTEPPIGSVGERGDPDVHRTIGSKVKVRFRDRLSDLTISLGSQGGDDDWYEIAMACRPMLFALIDRDVRSFRHAFEAFQSLYESVADAVGLDDTIEQLDEALATLDVPDATLLWTPASPIIIPPPILLALPNDLLSAVKRSPELLFTLSGRDFEHLVADVFRSHGFSVDLTQQTRDGGKDIVAVLTRLGIPFKIVVECKRYASHQKVGIGVVQRIFGVAKAEQAQRGVVVTTSTFSGVARQFADQHSVDLRDYDALLKWIKES